MTIIKIFTSIKREYFKYIYLCDNSFYQSKLEMIAILINDVVLKILRLICPYIY